MGERTRRHLAWAATLAAIASLGMTITAFAVPYHPGPVAGTVGMIEVPGLLVLLGLVVRWVPRPWVVPVSLLVALASASWILRFLPDPTALAALGGVALWSAGPAFAAVAGRYPRIAENRLRHAVDDARRRQRLDLARDLHDFVAHDVTGIVIQAQAAQAAGGCDADAAFTALERIERAGLQALASMDMALHVLRDEDDPQPRTGPRTDVREPDLAHLPALITRFPAPGDARIVVDVDPRLRDSLPQEISAIAYRIVVEALTNVRRHAPASTTVEVGLGPADDASDLMVCVVNDLPEQGIGRHHPRRNGSGLTDLGRRVRDLGGSLDAGPIGNRWRLAARLPLPTTR
jgi:signal transduction histidine kinase